MNHSGIVHRSEDQQELVHLPLEQVTVQTWIVDVSARVALSQVFHNPDDKPTGRAKYVFPIPARSAVCAFEMEHEDGRIVRGVAKGKSEAVNDFDAALQAGKMAAIVEWVTDDIFTISVGYIPAGRSVTTRLTFVMDLMDDGIRDHVRLQLPVSVGMRYGQIPDALANAKSPTDLTRVQISVDIQMSEEILDIRSPTHPIKVLRYKTRAGKRSMRRMSASWTSPTFMESDFVLTIHSNGLHAPRCFAEVDPLGSNTIAMQLTLIPRFKMPRVVSQEYIFVVDRSGSMSAGRIETAKRTLCMLLRLLPNDNTIFNIISFGNEARSHWQNSVPYNENTLTDATSHTRNMSANYGGTEIANAMTFALGSRKHDRPTVVFVLTDGGAYDHDHPSIDVVRHAVSSAAPGCPIRVFTLGIGEQVSTDICEGIARAGNGECLLAVTTESITAKCAQLFRAGRTRIIDHISVDWCGSCTPPASPVVSFSEDGRSSDRAVQLAPPPAIQQVPYEITKIYPGMRFTVFAIMTHRKVPAQVKLRAKFEGVEKEEELVVPVIEMKPFRHAMKTLPLVHTLAARRLITDLEEGRAPLPEVIGTAPVDEVIKQAAIVRLGVQYQLLSQHTAFVAVELGNETVRDRKRYSSGDSQLLRHQRSDTARGSSYTLFDSLVHGLSQVVSSLFGYFQPPPRLRTVVNQSIQGITGAAVPNTSSSSIGGRSHGIDSTDTFSTLSSLEGSSSSLWTRSRTPSPPPSLEELPERAPSPVFDVTKIVSRPSVTLPASTAPLVTQVVYELQQLQQFDGSFELSEELASIVGKVAAAKNTDLNVDQKLWATVLAVAYLEMHLGSQPDLLECLQSKALEYIEGRGDSHIFDNLVKAARQAIAAT